MSTSGPLRAVDPERLGAYRLVRRLGQGGQGTVYLATAPGGAPVAVKLMHSRLDDEVARRRFAGEVEAVRRVAPFCTAQVLDADLHGDQPYIVSEYVDGISLQQHVNAEGPRTGGSLDRIAVGTATALAAIHGSGVVHRDFKPGNVLLGHDGPRVIDFGISRVIDTATTTGRAPVGTPAYISPEQLKGERAGTAADIFGWGLTVAFAAGGRHAYAAEFYEAVLGRILFGKPDLDPLSGTLRTIVEACLHEDPARRPSAEEVLRRLIGRNTVPFPALSPGGFAEAGGLPEVARAVAADRDPREAWRGAEPGRAPDDAPVAHEAVPEDDRAAGPGVPPRAAEPGAHVPVGGRDDRPTAGGHGSGERAAGDGGVLDTLITPAVSTSPLEPAPAAFVPRSRLPLLAALFLALLTGVAGAALWMGMSEQDDSGLSYTGRWSGSAVHPTAGRVFPVEIDLPQGAAGPGTMRWGSDLHCSGRLVRAGGRASAPDFRLADVRGAQCHTSTVELSWKGPGRMAFEVTRPGERTPRYSGTAVAAP
ncbi:serine/threonine-protein kinase [Sphaerisporangium sp. TRM90804]|uniref:serine/threonine-protein kinase n=1 Tax=Sphaerisporangium sp. TRM90804 TaxID=3031113 RepID=UPI0024474A8B|nr:serine/threonine-protein kinase [Sphaerisporangium sp. TRM90804]MDH2427704.1 serine/threonine-protein kinase [Sphaerisporangium sp. TRM90804]